VSSFSNAEEADSDLFGVIAGIFISMLGCGA
jgi:hypothetical protein